MIRIITAADARLKPLALESRRKADELGQPIHFYDLGGLGFGQPFEVSLEDLHPRAFPPTTFKPRVMALAAETFRDEYLAWIDGDCVLQQRIDEICTDDYLVGVTEREPWEIQQFGGDPRVRTVNAGVVFFRNRPELRAFLAVWSELAETLQNDQWALNNLLEADDWPFRTFPCRLYNNYYFDPKHRPKIIHYKGDYQNQWLSAS